MQRKAILGLAVRIIAILLIMWSLRYLVQMCGVFVSYWGQDGDTNILQFIPMLLSSVVMLIIAVALIKNAESIAQRAYPVETMEDIDEVGLFNLAMKVIGLVFMVWAIPDMVQIICKFLYISYLTPVWSHETQTMYIVDHLPITLLFLILGWYLIKDGSLFTKMAFEKKNE